MKFSKALQKTAIVSVYEFSNDYHNFLISDFVYKNRNTNMEEIKIYLIKKNLNNQISIGESKSNNIYRNKGKVKISRELKVLHSAFYKFRDHPIYIEEIKILDKVTRLKENTEIPIDNELIFNFLKYQYKPSNEKDYEFIHFIMHFIVSKREDLYRYIDNLVHTIIDNEIEHSLFKYISDDTAINFFSLININSVTDLIKVSPNLIILLLNIQILTFSKLILTSGDELKQKVNIKMEETVSKIKNWPILIKNSALFESKTFTLESTGKEIGVTRERVRQIINKAKLDLRTNTNKSFFIIDAYIRNLLEKKLFLHVENIKLNKDQLTFILLFIEVQESYQFDYNRELKIIYNSVEISIDELEKIYLDKMEFFYPSKLSLPKSFQSDNELKLFKQIILKNYRKTDNLLLRRGFLVKDVLLKLIDDNFPNGYRISDPKDFEKLNSILEKKYNAFVEDLNPRRIITLLSNSNYALINRGTYINSDKLPKLDFDLLKQIELFILENQPAVYYKSIFTHFKNSFSKFGIDNYYYVKGVIDKEFQGQFLTKRDYIATEPGLTPSMSILEFVLTKKEVVTLAEIQKKFLGIQDYVINQIMDKTAEIIKLSESRYIQRRMVEIDEKTLNIIYEFIDGLMNEIGVDTISVSKLFARIQLNAAIDFDRFAFINNEFDLYQILKQCYPSDFHYENYYISQTEANNTYIDLIIKYFKDSEIITKRDIDEFVTKMNIRPISNFLKLVGKLKENFLQVDMDILVNLKYFTPNSDNLEKIQWNLGLLTEKNSEIPLSKITRFHTFPNLDFQWNQYLIAGLVRTFFNHLYDLENTHNQYNKTNFIIKRGESYGRNKMEVSW